MKRERPVIGWREWVELPELIDLPIKAKIDSGARTSSIHSFGTRRFYDGGAPWVEFLLHPIQRHATPEIAAVAPIKDERWVKSSNGEAEKRIVIETAARLGEIEWTIELTLASRDVMGFRMLLGREAIRRRFLIDPGRSFRQSDRHPAVIESLEQASS
ncbi:ATP-dependent zinc protease [Sphingosinicella humi]|uniref:ATP-dependent zinc protease n=1 Tax=Allosphingosinicella humi TaxID=2068657 RepID=A0A2U2J1T9_9SPHN|nr:RimK/LysX family protein [Sphingosinicella humi]PWG02303.1 ATP-dependent zinc protease [Sphingosinicella humi]